MSDLTKTLGIELPLICGAMYPCSNAELVAAASEAGAIGIVQPISLTFVHGHDFREGLRYIKSLTSKPFGLNVIVEKSAKIYEDRAKKQSMVAVPVACLIHFLNRRNARTMTALNIALDMMVLFNE